MIDSYLQKVLWKGTYVQKQGTDSYTHTFFAALDSIEGRAEKAEARAALVEEMLEEGKEMLLPIRLSFLLGVSDTAKVSNTGRGQLRRAGQLKSAFTLQEVSPYKRYRPFKVVTSIWPVEGYKCFYYGLPAITQEEGKVGKDNGDLLVLYTSNWREVSVFVFKGVWKGDNFDMILEAVDYVDRTMVR